MITTRITHGCPNCRSTHITGNGHTRDGNGRCLCHDCGKTRVLIPRRTNALHSFLEGALRERLSLRGLGRLFGLSVQTVLLLLRQLAEALPAFRHSVAPGRADEVLKLDELYSFVHGKKQKRGLRSSPCAAARGR